MSEVLIYHNPRWSKSRESVQILNELGVEYSIRNYIVDPPDIDELKIISSKLGLHPKEFIRSREPDYKENRLDEFLDNEDVLFEKMSKYPKLIERPIIIIDNTAVLGRPPEKVKKFFVTDWNSYHLNNKKKGKL